jgi:hypothetical protein
MSVLCRLIGHRWRYTVGRDASDNGQIVTVRRCLRRTCPRSRVVRVVRREEL